MCTFLIIYGLICYLLLQWVLNIGQIWLNLGLFTYLLFYFTCQQYRSHHTAIKLVKKIGDARLKKVRFSDHKNLQCSPVSISRAVSRVK